MMKTRLEIFATLLCASGLSGCGWMSGILPDKQKQYQYTSEIPPLEVPPDLLSSTVEGAKVGRGAEDLAPPAEPVPPEKKPAALAQNTDDIPLIEIDAPFSDAWNDVARALGRMKVEISDQNRSDGVYYVYFPGTGKHEDRGFWGDVADLFTPDQSPAKEYRIKLEELRKTRLVVTNVYVFDDQGAAVRDGPGLDLLKQLNAQLQNLSSPEGGASPAPSAEPVREDTSPDES